MIVGPHTQIITHRYIYTYVQYTDERCLPWLMAAQGLLDQLGGFERSSRSYGEDVFISERVPEDVNEHEISWINSNLNLLQDLFEYVQTVATVSPRQQAAIQLEAASGSSTCSQRPGGEGLDHDHWLSVALWVCHGVPIQRIQGVPNKFPRDSQGIPKLLKRFDGPNGFFPRRCRRTMPSQLRPSW